jgi:two-component system cell cycle response regulator DivK
MAEGRILYVEDNFDNRILIKRVLEAEGYTVIEAGDGLEGLKLAHSDSPDLILIDINLPDVDGYECTRRLRASESTRDIPILALTANVLEGDKQKALGVGCDGYISKPIDVDELPHTIEIHLRAAAQAGQTAQAPARTGLLSRVDGHQPADANPPGAMSQRDGRPDADGRQTGPPERAGLRGSTRENESRNAVERRSPTVETPAAPSRNIGASTHDRSNAL